MTQKIGKDALLLRALAQIRARADPRNAHLSHMPLDRFPVHLHSFQLELSRNLSRPIKRPFGVDLINAVFELDFCG
jgi:hypothetical protein